MSSINLSANNMNTTIVCIPGVFPNIGEDRISRAFSDLDIGEIVRIDIVKPRTENSEASPLNETSKNKKALNRVFVHLNLNTTRQAMILKEKLLQGKQIKIVYDQPWFWNISLYKKKEKAPEEPKQQKYKHKKATLKFEDEEDDEKLDAPVVIKQEPEKIKQSNETVCTICSIKGHIDRLCLIENPEFFVPPKQIDYGGLENSLIPPPTKRKTKIVIDNNEKPSSWMNWMN